MISRRILVLTASVVLLWPALALAQGGGSASGGGGSTSSSTGGASTSAASQAGSTFGGSSTGAGAAGGGGGGAAGGGLTQPALTEFGQAGANVGTGFVGRGNNAQAFVGASAAGQQTVDAGGTARFSGLGGDGGGTGGGANTSQARGGQMRIPQRMAFSVPSIAPATLSVSLSSQFSRLQSRLPGVGVTATEPGHVVLRGSVESEQARKLAAAIARLEPGVRRVTNELRVDSGETLILPPRLGR